MPHKQPPCTLPGVHRVRFKSFPTGNESPFFLLEKVLEMVTRGPSQVTVRWQIKHQELELGDGGGVYEGGIF